VTGLVFLTGGTGFLGGALLDELAAREVEVHALARPGTPVSERPGVTWHRGELTDRASLAEGLRRARDAAGEGALDVVHSAAVISYRTRDRELQRRVNVGGTAALLEAAKRAEVRRFLHVSSVVAVGHAAGDEVLDEDSEYNGESLRVDYVDTKRAAEEAVLAARDELDVVVASPGAIFGPASGRSNSAHFLARMAAGAVRLAPPGAVGVVGVRDVAHGCALALERGRRGERYLLVESNLAFLEVIRQVARVCGVREPLGAVPAGPWRGVELLARGVDRVRALDRLTPQALRMLAARFRFDAGKARRELGWSPRPFPAVVRDALEGMGLLETGAGSGREG